MEGDDLFEKIKHAITQFRVREIRDRGTPGPGDDADQQDPKDDGTLDAEHHQHDRQDAAAKDADPHGRVAHLLRRRAQAHVVPEFGLATGQFERGRLGAHDGTDAGAVGQSDQGQVQPDADTRGEFDGRGDRSSEPLTKTEDRQADKDETFDEHGRDRHLVRDET